jgi:hypothetical protein
MTPIGNQPQRWLQNELERTLNHAVADGGNRKNTNAFASVLRYLYPSKPHGTIAVPEQFIPELLEKCI